MDKIKLEDFSMDIIEDDQLEEFNGGAKAWTAGVSCLTGNIISITVATVSVTSTTKCSNPSNSYTEVSCC